MKYLIDRIVRQPLTLLLLVAGAALLPWGKAAAASYSCSAPAVSSLTANLGSPAVMVGRDVPNLTALTAWTSFTETPTNQWYCTMSNPTFQVDWINATFMSALTATGQNYSDPNGKTYPIFQTNVPGVGIVMGASSYESTTGFSRTYAPYLSSYSYGTGSTSSTQYSGYEGFGIAFRFIKIGTITPGAVSFAGPVAYGAPGGTGGGATPVGAAIPVTASGGPSFTVGSCTVADIDVDLGTHRPSEFTGVNSKTGITDFPIDVQNCPAGMNTVRYRLELAAGVPAFNATNGVVKLDAASTATGVGVQVMNRSNVAYNFSTMPWTNITPTYAPATGGTYTIPLRAAYYQTAATITPGTANSAVMFTMEYK